MLTDWVPSAAFCCDPLSVKKRIKQVSPGISMCFSTWEEELADDFDKDFILNGLQRGFDIIDENASPHLVKCENHPSARQGSPLYKEATEQVLKEIKMGHYEVLPEPPEIVSPIAVIPKPNGGVRLIHDCSRPEGQAVNDYCTADWKQKFSRVDDAAALVTRGCFMAKIDLQNAYRCVSISQHSQRVTGLQ